MSLFLVVGPGERERERVCSSVLSRYVNVLQERSGKKEGGITALRGSLSPSVMRVIVAGTKINISSRPRLFVTFDSYRTHWSIYLWDYEHGFSPLLCLVDGECVV